MSSTGLDVTPLPEENSCVACDKPNSACDIVQCDLCSSWWHQTCAGVTKSVEKHPWSCRKCLQFTASSVASGTSSARAKRAALRLKLLEEQQALELQALEAKKRHLKEKHDLLEAELEEEEAASVRSRVSRREKAESVSKWVEQLPDQSEGAVGPIQKDEEAAAQSTGVETTIPSLHPARQADKFPPIKQKDVPERSQQQRPTGTIPKQSLCQETRTEPSPLSRLETPVTQSTPPLSGKRNKPPKSVQINTPDSEPEPQMEENEPLQSLLQQLALDPAETDNFKRHLSHFTPTASQLAARQVMPRDLPTFTGSPSDWPIFISNFTTSTITCGYRPAENLMRLQRCLKGPALEAVRSRLLLPESVPHIIETLRLLYGRPELLIHSLLQKVRSVPTPRAEKLESLIDFGMAVQGLCDHLEAANQQEHLSNPMMLFELVEKLPPHIKMEWALYMQNYSKVNLRAFGDFMNEIVKSASRVTLYSGAASKSEEKPKPKRGVVHSHSEEVKNVGPAENEKQCPGCQSKDHRLKDCTAFKSYSVDERWKFINSRGICRNCLNAHGRRSCRNTNYCGVSGCQYRHNPLLHSRPANPSTLTAENHTHRSHHQTLHFRIVPVKLHSRNVVIETFAFLDDGSSITLIEERLVEQLGLDGDLKPLCLKWTNDMSRMEEDSKLVQVSVSHGSSSQMKLQNAHTVKSLALPKQSLDYERLASKYEHLRGLPIPGYVDAVPRILVGLDNLRLTVPLVTKEGRPGEPIAVKTRLGWCIYGGANGVKVHSLNYHYCECSEDTIGDRALHEAVKSYFTQEDTGTKPPIKLLSAEDRRALKILEETTKRVGDKFETGLLWRFDFVEFPDSYGMALKRLECLERRMDRDPQFKKDLFKQMESYLEKGYMHRASKEELLEADPRRVWYLPLGAVFNVKKPGKVRMIWDASATVGGISLNTMLLKGPDLLTSLPMVLFRFRQFLVAVSADVKEMFHQLSIRKQDRHAQRSLFRSSPLVEPEIYIMDVATFGSTSSPSSAQFVKNKNAQEFTNVYPRAVEGIVENTYVDDYLDSFQSEDEAAEVAQQVRLIHARGGFNIRNWQSNSRAVLESLDETVSSASKSLDLECGDVCERVLGLLWLPENDLLGFSSIIQPELKELISSARAPTKREVLRCLMSFFDPLGLLSAFTVHGKILLQNIWRSGAQWDDKINSELHEKWRKWVELFKSIESVKIPRCYFSCAKLCTYEKLELHVFVDASEEAYAAVAYFRTLNSAGNAEVTLVASKTKVAPLKPMSVPRLELQAAVLGARLMQFVVEGHSVPITKKTFWSDSSTVLAWLRADPRRFKQFVALRIGEILSVTELNEWRWVPSKQNIADQATKWGKGPQLDPSNEWFRGPTFLYETEENWPKCPVPKAVAEELLTVHTHHGIPIPVPIVEFDRFSRWEIIVGSMAYIYRWVDNFRKRQRGQEKVGGFLKQDELKRAETALIKMVQWETYPEELVQLHTCLSSKKELRIEKSSPLYRLSPQLDEDGVLRMDSRIVAAKNVPVSMKYPIILPKCHKLSLLIVHHFHRRYQHANAETVVNEVRQRYFIPQLRAAVMKVSRSCQWCKIFRAIPQTPRMAPLPSARMASFVRPFSYVGIDLFGPILVKVGRSTVKRWAVLFTCLTIRAVHIEVVFSLTTESCVMSIRRFIDRRGAPVEIRTDNGTNFRGADRVLQQQIANINENLASTFTNTTTKWIFIPPSAPHMGGSWERLVRSVKTAMEAATTTQRMDDEALLTVLIEAEAIVNSRPLTYLPLDSEEQEALTPNHFLLGSSSGVKQPIKEPVDEAAILRKSWQQLQLQLDTFWRRWVREYLPTLTRRTKWFGEVKAIEVGDLVFVIDETRRNGWIRGRVVEVVKGQDGRVRQAVVQTSKGLMRRPVSKLARLEVTQDGNNEPTTSGDQCYEGEDVATWEPCPPASRISVPGTTEAVNCHDDNQQQKTSSAAESS